MISLKVEVSLFVPSQAIEDRNGVDVGNWTNKIQELCDLYVFTISSFSFV
jgi:hypothetical protein